MWDATYPYLAALLPTAGILVLFYVVFRNLLAADRQERKAQAQWEAARNAFDDDSLSHNPSSLGLVGPEVRATNTGSGTGETIGTRGVTKEVGRSSETAKRRTENDKT